MASKQLLFKSARIKPVDSPIVPDTKVQDENIQEGKKGNSKPKTKSVIIEEIQPMAENLNQYLVDKNDSEEIYEYIGVVDPIILEDKISDDSNENFNNPVDQNLTENDDLKEG